MNIFCQRRSSVLNRCKVFSLASAIFFLILTFQAVASELSEDDLSLISRFEAESGQSFVDFFTKVVHQVETCSMQNGVCKLDLQKRVKNYDLFIDGQSYFADQSKKEALGFTFAQTAEDIESATGLIPLIDHTHETATYILVVFIDRQLFEEDREAFLEKLITRPNYTEREYRERTFLGFMDDQGAPCLAFRTIIKSGEIADAHIWIKNDISGKLLQKCIAKALFNTFGIDEGDDVPSIFDWPLSDFEERNGLSSFHLLLLKLLYRPEFQPGQSKAETRADIERLVAPK